MLDVSYAANSCLKIDQTTVVLEGAALLDVLKIMSDKELAEFEDELNFAHFTGIFGPILSEATSDSFDSKQGSIRQTDTGRTDQLEARRVVA